MGPLHQGGRGLGPSQHKTKTFLSSVKDNSAGFVDSEDKMVSKLGDLYYMYFLNL